MTRFRRKLVCFFRGHEWVNLFNCRGYFCARCLTVETPIDVTFFDGEPCESWRDPVTGWAKDRFDGDGT